MAARFYFNSQQTWWIRALQCREVHPSATYQTWMSGFAKEAVQLELLSKNVLRLAESILRHPSSSTAARIRLLLFYLCTLKVRTQLKKATGCEILQPHWQSDVWKCGSQHSARQKLELESRQVPGNPELRKVLVTLIESKMGDRIDQENQKLSAVRQVTGRRQPSKIWCEQEHCTSSSPTRFNSWSFSRSMAEVTEQTQHWDQQENLTPCLALSPLLRAPLNKRSMASFHTNGQAESCGSKTNPRRNPKLCGPFILSPAESEQQPVPAWGLVCQSFFAKSQR